jgi:hypothetical protein
MFWGCAVIAELGRRLRQRPAGLRAVVLQAFGGRQCNGAEAGGPPPPGLVTAACSARGSVLGTNQ